MSNVTVIVGLQWGNEGKGRIAHHTFLEIASQSVLLAAAAQVTP